MKEVLYNSIMGFIGMNGVVYASPDLMQNAREILSRGNGYEQIGINGYYHIGDCTIIDMRGLGLRIQYEKDEQLESIVSRLFSKENASQA